MRNDLHQCNAYFLSSESHITPNYIFLVDSGFEHRTSQSQANGLDLSFSTVHTLIPSKFLACTSILVLSYDSHINHKCSRKNYLQLQHMIELLQLAVRLSSIFQQSDSFGRTNNVYFGMTISIIFTAQFICKLLYFCLSYYKKRQLSFDCIKFTTTGRNPFQFAFDFSIMSQNISG